MRRLFLVLLGLILIGVAAAWFFTPIGEQVVADYARAPSTSMEAQSTDSAKRSVTAPAPQNMDMLNTVLNALNAVFGAVGIFLTLRGVRARQ